jgi:hypothetical protein
MKQLDSIGVMLLLSSSIVFDSAAQGNKKMPDNLKPLAVASSIPSAEPGETVQPDPEKSKAGEGTFYATSLFWSGKDKELYFKGNNIQVKFEDQNFVASGTANFLGPVHLLIFNDEQMTPDSKIELSRKQYRLDRLSNKKALEKYGDIGRQGAIEISEVE